MGLGELRGCGGEDYDLTARRRLCVPRNTKLGNTEPQFFIPSRKYSPALAHRGTVPSCFPRCVPYLPPACRRLSWLRGRVFVWTPRSRVWLLAAATALKKPRVSDSPSPLSLEFQPGGGSGPSVGHNCPSYLGEFVNCKSARFYWQCHGLNIHWTHCSLY